MSSGILSSYLEARARELWPDISCTCEFRPVLDSPFGLFSTDLCVRISPLIRMSPAQAGNRLVGGTSEIEDVTFRLEGDFIYVDLDPSLLEQKRLRELLGEFKPVPSLITAPPLASGAAPAGYMRTLSMAWEQFVVMKGRGVECSLSAPGEGFEYGELSGLDGYASLLEKVGTGPAGGRESAACISDAVEQAGMKKVFIWLANDSLPRKEFQALYTGHIHRQKLRFLCCPDFNWLSTREQIDVPGWLNDRDVFRRYALLLYLCSEVSSDDLDLNVPTLCEKDNLLWFLKSLVERVQRCREGAGVSRACGGICSAGSPTVLRRLRTLVALFPFIRDRACSHGELETFNLAVRRMAHLLSISLNEASVRAALAGQVDHEEIEIIYSAARTFSDIMSWVS